MFNLSCCSGKNSVQVAHGVADESRKRTSSQSSVSISLTSAANIKSKEKISIWNHLFGRPMEKTRVISLVDKTSEPKEKCKKPCWWHKVCQIDMKCSNLGGSFSLLRQKSNKVAPALKEPGPKRQCPPTPHQDTVAEVKGGKGPLFKKVLPPVTERDEGPKISVPKPVGHQRCPPTTHQDTVKEVTGVKVPLFKKVLPPVTEKDEKPKISVPKPLRHQQFNCLGLPNNTQICYMNSCLQSLLTLEDFVKSISCQEPVWSLTPGTAIMSSFMDISKSHLSRDACHKTRLLTRFKNTVAALDPEFADLDQKDAHEFLISVLHQMRSLKKQLRMKAASMDRTYSCPVEDHMLFKMKSIRTCKRCGARSTREEEFTNLSLDLMPGKGTIEKMLENYLKETELEYKCECSGTVSRNSKSFVNLPGVLVLHLKRFRYTPKFKKVNDPVDLMRELLVSSREGDACYSLVSTISHLGHSAKYGHYISDGVDIDVGQEDLNDRWFTYNDAVVTETTGHSVCARRQSSSYILFYKRHD